MTFFLQLFIKYFDSLAIKNNVEACIIANMNYNNFSPHIFTYLLTLAANKIFNLKKNV